LVEPILPGFGVVDIGSCCRQLVMPYGKKGWGQEMKLEFLQRILIQYRYEGSDVVV